MNQELEDRIRAVVSAVLGLSADEINADSSPDTVEQWDSMKHMNMVVALEEEFDIEFTDDEIMEMSNFGQITENVAAKL